MTNRRMSDERLAYMEDWARHGFLTRDHSFMVEALEELRRERARHREGCISRSGGDNDAYCDCATLAIIEACKDLSEQISQMRQENSDLRGKLRRTAEEKNARIYELVAALNEARRKIQEGEESFSCPAVMHHGPGSQSKTRCERKDRHDLWEEHSANNPMEPGFEWTGQDGWANR